MNAAVPKNASSAIAAAVNATAANADAAFTSIVPVKTGQDDGPSADCTGDGYYRCRP
jgi:hypothetical protein